MNGQNADIPFAANPTRTLSWVLVLFPIGFGLAILTFLLAGPGLLLPVVMNSLAMFTAFLAAVVTTVGFVIVIVMYFYAKHHFDGNVSFGIAFWLAVAAAAALFVASSFLGLGICCGGNRRREKQRTNDETMYNRLFAPQQSGVDRSGEERINMEDVQHQEPVQHEEENANYVNYSHGKTDSYDTRASAAPVSNYYPRQEDVYEEQPGSSSIALVPAIGGASYLGAPQRSGPVLEPELEEEDPETYARRRSLGHYSSVEGHSEYEDAVPPSEHFVDARPAAETPMHTASYTSSLAPAMAYSAAPQVGAYDPAPALPNHLRGGTTATQSLNNDSWFLPGAPETSRGTELPKYDTRQATGYPLEKGGAL